MTLFRNVLVTSGIAIALFGGAVDAQAAGAPMQALRMPATPAPVAVTLDPNTTALLVLDLVDDICAAQPSCQGQMLPAMTPFMTKVREAGATIVYGTRAPRMDSWMPEIAPQAGDLKVVNVAQDRFYGTDFDQQLKAKGIETIIIAGWRISGSITFTSVGAMDHGYTVVIPTDTTSSPSDYETAIGFYMVQNAGTRNPDNEPMAPNAVTLSRTDLISFR
jgi:nicotinamidase-related amidase